MTVHKRLDDDKSAVRVLARLHPEWSIRKIARDIGRSGGFVTKWLERTDNDNLPRGNTTQNTVITDAFLKTVKRKMIGSLDAHGGGKRRKSSIREMVREFEGKGIDCSYGSVRTAVSSLSVYRRRRKRVRLIEDHANRRFLFADSCLSWDDNKWKTLFNTDSSPFYLSFKNNRQNDGFWCLPGVNPPAGGGH